MVQKRAFACYIAFAFVLCSALSTSCRTNQSLADFKSDYQQAIVRLKPSSSGEVKYRTRHYIPCTRFPKAQIRSIAHSHRPAYKAYQEGSHSTPSIQTSANRYAAFDRVIDQSCAINSVNPCALVSGKKQPSSVSVQMAGTCNLDTAIIQPLPKAKRTVPPILIAGILSSFLGVFLIPVITGPLGIALCWIGFRQIRMSPEKRKGRALAGLGMIVGLLTFALGLYLLLFALAFLIAG